MRKNKNTKGEVEKIYLDDLPLNNGSSDKFQTRQVSQLLKQSIEQSKFPIHISLLARWGSGKTTVIKMLENELDKKKYDLKIISVWKFADDAPSLHRKIVREVERNLNQENPENLDSSTTVEKSLNANGILSSLTLLKRMGDYKSIIIVNFIIFLLLLAIQLWLPSSFSPIASNGVILLLASFATAFLARNSFGIITSIKNVKTSLPLSFGDQYENRFKQVVEKHLGKKSDKKLILVFDDLDRLPPKQLYGALNTIKTFLHSDRCAFIIPCDERVLKEELQEAFDKKEMPSFDVTEYLNKTFDLTVRLPKLEPQNMKKYAKSLLEGEGITWYKENSSIINELLAILIHSEVLTPRHVKKNLNVFATDWELAKKRDNSNKNGNFLTLHPEQIAVFAVLKSDFSEFYDSIIENSYFIRDVIDVPPSERRKLIFGVNIADEDEDEKTDNTGKKNTHEDKLLAFLSKIDDLIPEDPRPFVYFNNEELNPLTGRLDLENVKKYVLNGQREEFNKAIEKINKEDLHLTFSSIIADISSNVEAKKLFSILFNQPEIVEFIEPKDKVPLAELFKHNLKSLIEYPLRNILSVFNDMVNQPPLWKKLGILVAGGKTYTELLECHIDSPELVQKLEIQSIYDIYSKHAISIGIELNDDYYVPALVMDLSENHPIVRNVSWYDSLLNCFAPNKENEEDDDGTSNDNSVLSFNLADWTNIVNSKSNQTITTSQINNLLKSYGFVESKNLQNIVTSWMNHFNAVETNEMARFLAITGIHLPIISTEEEFKEFGKLVKTYENNTKLKEAIDSFIDNAEDELETEDMIAVLEAFKDTKTVAEFAKDKFLYKSNEMNEHLAHLLVYHDEFYEQESMNEMMDRVNSRVFGNPKLPEIDLISKLIKESPVWKTYAEKFSSSWFISNDLYVWFKWDVSEENFTELLNVFYYLNQPEKNAWTKIFDSMRQIISVNHSLVNNNLSSYQYKVHWTLFLKKAFDFMINNCKSEETWNEAFKSLFNIQQTFNQNLPNVSIFDYLDQETINKFIAKASNVIPFGNERMNELIFERAELRNTVQLNHVINRWEFFSPSQRETLSGKIPEENAELLYNHITENPEIKYIDELAGYSLEESLKESIMRAIIAKVDVFTLNKWISETLSQLITSNTNKWRMSAILYALDLRTDMGEPEIDLLERLLDFKDERTKLAFEIVLKVFPKSYKNKPKFKEVRRRILVLEDTEDFKELVMKAKDKYSWRNNMLA